MFSLELLIIQSVLFIRFQKTVLNKMLQEQMNYLIQSILTSHWK